MVPHPSAFEQLSIAPEVARLYDEQQRVVGRMRDLRRLRDTVHSRRTSARAADLALAAAAVRNGDEDPGGVRVKAVDREIESQSWERDRLARQNTAIDAEFARLVRGATDLPTEIDAQLNAVESQAAAALDAFAAAHDRLAMLRAVARWARAGGEADIEPRTPLVPGIVPSRGRADSIPYRLDEVIAGLRRVNEPPPPPKPAMPDDSREYAEQTRIALGSGR